MDSGQLDVQLNQRPYERPSVLTRLAKYRVREIREKFRHFPWDDIRVWRWIIPAPNHNRFLPKGAGPREDMAQQSLV